VVEVAEAFAQFPAVVEEGVVALARLLGVAVVVASALVPAVGPEAGP